MCSVSGGRLLYSHRRLHACQPPCSPTPAPLLPDSLRIFLALMRCPVKSRNGNNLRAKKAEPRRRARILVRFDCDLRWKATNEMTVEVNLVFCVLVVLTGSSRTRGQSSVLPPVVTLAALPSHTGSSASPHLTEGPGSETSQWTHYPASRDETSAQTTTITRTKGTVHSEPNAVSKTHLLTTGSAVATSEPTSVPVMLTAHADTPSPSAAADGLSLTLAFRSTTSPQHPSVSSQADVNPRSTVYASTFQPRSESLITAAATGHPLTSAAGRDPAGPTHQDVPSVLNVGDEDPKRPRPRSPLDPLLAGLMSVFIVTTAIFFIVLFLRFRQRTNHPEFHRLQDLPMDDLMEDTPLSRYTY